MRFALRPDSKCYFPKVRTKSLRKIVIKNWLEKMQRINPELWCPVDMSRMTYEIVVASYMTTKRDVVNGRLLEVEELIVAQGKQPSCIKRCSFRGKLHGGLWLVYLA
jgi:hypothetical protein